MNIYCICLPVFISFRCDFRLLSEATQKYSILLRLPVAPNLSQDFFRKFKEDETSWQCPPVLFYREIMRVNAIFPSAQLSGLDLPCRFDIGVMTSVAGNPLLTLNSLLVCVHSLLHFLLLLGHCLSITVHQRTDWGKMGKRDRKQRERLEDRDRWKVRKERDHANYATLSLF